jgi:hypothetical protein
MDTSHDDPHLTSYTLGELDADEMTAMDYVVAENPELQLEIQELQKFNQLLSKELSHPTTTLLAEQRAQILETAWELEQPRTVPFFTTVSETIKTWFIPASAAAILTLTTFILLRIPDDSPAIAKKTTAPNNLTTDPTADKPEKPSPRPRSSGNSVDHPELNLPAKIADSNYEEILKSIREAKKLPSRDAIRLEEILSHFPLRLNGVASIARSETNIWHPDNRDSGVSSCSAILTSETISCPWKPSATLLLISLRGNSKTDCNVSLSFHPNPKAVSRYKLLGFESSSGEFTESQPTKLLANSSTTLAIEIEPINQSTDLGSLQWSVNDKAAPNVSLVHKSSNEPSDDARFASLVCTYSQWLTGEHAGVLNKELLSALTRETRSDRLPEDRADFIKLVNESLSL